MNDFHQASIRTLPLEWDVVPLRDTCLDFFGGGTPSTNRPEFWDGDVAWTTSAHLNGLYLKSGQRWITEAGLRQSSSRVVPAGNLLIGTGVGVGKTAVNLIDIAISQDLTAGVVNKERFYPEFLALYLQTNRCQAIFELQKRGATIKGIPREDLYRIEVAAPPLPEQRAIAAVLSKVQAAVEVQDKIVTTLKELKAATMAKLFRDGLRGEPLKQTEIGEIPESWEVMRLDTLTDLASGGTPSKSRLEWWEGPIPWASPKDMKQPRLWDTEDHISAEALEHGSRLVPAKTIFVVIRGMILAKDLPVAIAEVPMAFNQDMKAVLPRDLVDADYLMYAIGSRKGALVREIGTSAHGTRRMGTSSLEALLLPLPTKEEQGEIAAALRSLEQREAVASRARDTLKSLFSSMLHLLMTGQVRVNNLRIEEVSK